MIQSNLEVGTMNDTSLAPIARNTRTASYSGRSNHASRHAVTHGTMNIESIRETKKSTKRIVWTLFLFCGISWLMIQSLLVCFKSISNAMAPSEPEFVTHHHDHYDDTQHPAMSNSTLQILMSILPSNETSATFPFLSTSDRMGRISSYGVTR